MADDPRIKDSSPSELSLLGEALRKGEALNIPDIKRYSIDEVSKRLRKLRPQAKGPRPTPIKVSPRKRKRRAARDARKLNRA